MPDFAAARSRLEKSLTELEERLTHVVRDLDQPADADLAEQAIELEDDEALEHQAALITREITSVQQALRRIDGNTYGQCLGCGAEIASARLEARPEAALCIRCARNRG